MFFYTEQEIDAAWPMQPEHLLATLTHPRLRDFGGDTSLKDKAVELLRVAVSSSNDSLNNEVSTCNACASSDADISTTPTVSNILSLCFDKPRAAKPAFDEVTLWLQSDFDSEINDDDIMSFWRRKQNHFPIIAGILRKLLAIPASNSAVERLFSSTKTMISDRRTRLGAEKIDKLMFLHKNLIPLNDMLDSKDVSATMSKRKADTKLNDDGDYDIFKKVKTAKENDNNLLSDEYESEQEDSEIEILL